MCFHVYLESILASEASFTTDDQTREASAVISLAAQGR